MRHAFTWMKALSVGFSILVFFSFQAYSFDGSEDTFEWELRVIEEKGDIHLEPDIKSPVVMTVPQSSILRSYEKEEEWFRVIFQHENGIVVIGYIHSSQVKVMKEDVEQKIDFWGEESGFFKGIGLTFKLSVGFNHIAAAEINEGIRGVVDYYKFLISSWGQYFDKEIEPFHSGFDFGADAIYSLNSYLGIGLGLSYVQWGSKSWLPLKETLYFARRLDSTIRVKAYPVRLGAYVTLPVFRNINLTFNAGPSYHFVKYTYNMSYRPYAVILKANGQGWGVHGGIGFELEWNSRSTLFIEYEGRYAKLSGFKGIEEEVVGTSRDKTEGPLLYIAGEGLPTLIGIFREPPSWYDTVRKAEFDLSGFAVRIGAKVKF
jgi:hypothetical protein